MPFLTQIASVHAGNTVVTVQEPAGMRSHWVKYDDTNAVFKLIDEAVEAGSKVYITPCAFRRRRRSLEHAAVWRAVWLDIDAGAAKHQKHGDKVYATQEDAKANLFRLVATGALAEPTFILSSGAGLHVYWCWDTDMEYDAWKLASSGLAAICSAEGLLIDQAVTNNGVTLMRCPGSFNSAGLLCEIIYEGAHADVDFLQVLQGKGVIPSKKSAPLPTVGGAFAELAKPAYAPKHWDGIIRSCAQVISFVARRATLSEPEWRAALSIANAVVDREHAIREVSIDHPEYSLEASIEKAEKTTGPYTCQALNILCPNVCTNCPFAGDVNSPISLGAASSSVIKIALPADEEEGTAENFEEVFVPFGYIVKDNKIYKRVEDPKTKEKSDVLVSPFLLYITQRYSGEVADGGNMYVLRVHFPNDGTKDTIIRPGVLFHTAQSFAKAMYSMDVVLDEGQMNMAKGYLQAQVRNLITKTKLGNKHEQLGWSSDMSTFVCGNKEWSALGSTDAQFSGDMEVLGRYTKPKGTLEGWIEFVDKGYNYPGNEAHQFGVLCGFGSALLRLENIQGGVIHLFNDKSGTGKTTIQEVGCSIWGNPEKLLNINSDTQAALYHKRGLYNSIPFNVNEITVWEYDRLAEFVYNSTNGKGKDRMRNSDNSLRDNRTSWDGYTITSGNINLNSLLSGKMAASGGMLMRVLSIPIPMSQTKLRPSEAYAHFQKRGEHYGHAGIVFIRDILSDIDGYKRMLCDTRDFIMEKASLSIQHRYWASMAACALVSGFVTQELGLHKFDMTAISSWLIGLLRSQASEASDHQASEVDLFVRYVNNNLDSILFIGADGGPRQGRIPNRSVKMRLDEKENLFSFSTDSFMEFANTQLFNPKRVFDMLSAVPGVTTKLMNLGAGTQLPEMTTRCMVLDTRSPGVKSLFTKSLDI